MGRRLGSHEQTYSIVRSRDTDIDEQKSQLKHFVVSLRVAVPGGYRRSAGLTPRPCAVAPAVFAKTKSRLNFPFGKPLYAVGLGRVDASANILIHHLPQTLNTGSAEVLAQLPRALWTRDRRTR